MSGCYDFDFFDDPKRGRQAVVKDIPVSISAKDRDLSLAVKGAKMFNLLPRCLRDYKSDSVDNFKDLLDKFLENIPDTPVPIKITRFILDKNSVKNLCLQENSSA